MSISPKSEDPTTTAAYVDALNAQAVPDSVTLSVNPKKASKTTVSRLISTVSSGKLGKAQIQELKDIGATVEEGESGPVIGFDGFTLEFKSKPQDRPTGAKNKHMSKKLKWRPHITNFDHVALNVRDPDKARALLKALDFKSPGQLDPRQSAFDGYSIGGDGEFKLRVEPYADPSGNIMNLVFDEGGQSVVKRQLDYEENDAALHHLGFLVNGSQANLSRGPGILEKFVKRKGLKPAVRGEQQVNTVGDKNGFLSQTFLAPLSSHPDAPIVELISRFKWPWFVEQNSKGLEESIR